jgi:arabinogalactan endo-1,4-beta-galactosidase
MVDSLKAATVGTLTGGRNMRAMMRRTSVLTGLVLVSLVYGDRPAAAQTAPALVNPSFEADGTGVANPIGWTTSGDVNASYTEWGGHSSNYRLSHWSPNAYSVDTTQTLNDVPEGWYTVSAWARRSNGRNDTYMAFQCGHEVDRTYVPAAWSGQWVQIVASVHARGRSCTVDLHSDADAGEWTNFDDLQITPGATKLSVSRSPSAANTSTTTPTTRAVRGAIETATGTTSERSPTPSRS